MNLRSERAATLIEFALTLPILLMLMFGMIEFGRILNAQIMVTSAAREGARLAALGVNAGQVEAHVRDSCASLAGDALVIEITNAGGSSGSPVAVRVGYPVEIVVPLMEDILGEEDAFMVEHEVTMRLE